jgi:hypothetical protein
MSAVDAEDTLPNKKKLSHGSFFHIQISSEVFSESGTLSGIELSIDKFEKRDAVIRAVSVFLT